MLAQALKANMIPTFNDTNLVYDPAIVIALDGVCDMKPYQIYGDKSSTSGAIINRDIHDGLSIQETLHCHLNPESLRPLCEGGRFAPTRKSNYKGETPLTTNPIHNPMARGKVFDGIKTLHNGRLWIDHDKATNKLTISARRSRNDNYAKRQANGRQSNGRQPAKHQATNDKASNEVKKDDVKGVKPRDQRDIKPVAGFKYSGEQFEAFQGKWKRWGAVECVHETSHNESSQYAQTKNVALEKAEALANAKRVTYAPPPTLFKQTTQKKSKFTVDDITSESKTETTTEHKVESKTENAEPQKAEGFIAPHLRKKMLTGN